MKALTLEFLANFWAILNSIALFMLIGILVAGIVKHFLPNTLIKKQLTKQKSGILAIIKASILGMARASSTRDIRFIQELRKAGSNKDTMASFLVATPATTIDSIFVGFGAFGWFFILYKTLSNIVIAIIAGVLSALFIHEKETLSLSDINTPSPSKAQNTGAYSVGIPLSIQVVKAENKTPLFKQVLAYAFDTLYKGIARSLLLSIVLSALIITFIPENIANLISSNPSLSYAIALLIAIPLSLSATSSIPLAFALLSAGFSSGVALMLLTIMPTINRTHINSVLKMLGRKSLFIFIFSVLLGGLFFGLLFDQFFSESLSGINLIRVAETDPGFLAQISSVIILYLSLKYSFNSKTKVFGAGGCGSEGGCASGGCSTGKAP